MTPFRKPSASTSLQPLNNQNVSVEQLWHSDAFELLQLAKEVLDEVPPFVDLTVDVQRFLTLWHLRDDDLGPPLVQLVNNPVRIERLVGDQSVELDTLDQRSDADRIVSVCRSASKLGSDSLLMELER